MTNKQSIGDNIIVGLKTKEIHEQVIQGEENVKLFFVSIVL